MQWSSRQDRPDELEIAFTDEELDHDLNSAVIRPKGADPTQRISRRVDATGVRRLSQLRRVYPRELRALQRNNKTFSIAAANWRLLRLEAGDFIKLTSPRMKTTNLLCRVVQAGFGSNLFASVKVVLYDTTIDDTDLGANLFAGTGNAVPALEAAATVTVPAPEKIVVSKLANGSWRFDVGNLNWGGLSS